MPGYLTVCLVKACCRTVFIFLFLFLAGSAEAQKIRLSSNAALAEKVYVQTDGQVYTLGQTIWLKALVIMASDHSLTTLSGVLYVELIGPDEKVLERKLVKLDKGIGASFFDLEKEYPAGEYLLRAYTEWNRNYGKDFIFKSYLKVYPSKEGTQAIEPIANTTLIKEEGKIALQANLRPSLIDSLHSEKLSVYVTVDDTKDSIKISNRRGEYFLDYDLPPDTRVVNVHIETENKQHYSKSLLVDETAFDLSFFPESGELVHGISSKVGFKALSTDGAGKVVQGQIVDDQGRLVSDFKTNVLGMGSVMLLADSNRSYYANVSGGEGLVLKYPLPKVERDGYVLSVVRVVDELVINASSSLKSEDSVMVQVSSRGRFFFDVKGRLNKDGQLQFKLAAKRLPEGVVSFTLMDEYGLGVAERLYFVERPGQRLQIEVVPDKQVYQQREKANVDIVVRDFEGYPIEANLSAMVINKSQMGEIQDSRNNLLSYLLLTSDLNGEIEKPGYYFNDENTERIEDLDALMLTQGWRKYRYRVVPLPDRFQPEYNLTVSGKVGGVLSGKKSKEGIGLTLITFGNDSRAYERTSDSVGRFYFDVNDEFGRNMNVSIQTKNKRGKRKAFTVLLDKKASPQVSFDHRKSLQPVDSLVEVLAEKHQERELIDAAYGAPDDVRDLGVVVVEDYALTPLREKMMKAHGKPDVVVDGEAIREEERKWSYGLYSVLRNTMRDQLLFTDEILFNQQFRYAEAHGSDLTMIMVDGILVRLEYYSLVPNIPVSEVKSVEILKHPKNFFDLFYQLFPPDAEIPLSPSILSIYTFSGKGIFGTSVKPGMFKGAIPVYSPSREFYAPKYEKLTPQDWVKPDYRALVHWEPILKTDSLGRVKLSYYNADPEGEVMVVIEAIAAGGQIGYQQHTYKVEKRKDRP